MKQKRIIMGALLLLGLGLTVVQAQRMNVKTKVGTNTAFMINDVRNMTFSGGNLVVIKKDASTSSFPISDNRYINYSTGGVSTWNGTSWSPLAPTATDYVELSGNYNAAGFTCEYLTVNASKQLTIASGTMAVSGNVVLKSNATGTATLINNGTLTVGGTTNVEQYLTVARRWWYVSSPLSGAKTTTFTGSNLINGYAETTTSYSDSLATNVPLTVGKGYVVKLNDVSNGIYTFSGGSLNTGDVTLTPTRTGTTAAKRGFNLIGNPYPSFLNWNAVEKTKVRNTIWYRTFTSGDQMQFDTFDGTIGTSNGVNGEVSEYIPPMQAFWVKVEADGDVASLTFRNTMRSHQDQNTASNRLRTPSSENNPQLLRLKVSNGINGDETLITTHSNATDGWDSYDSEKMSNDNLNIPEIFTLAGNEKIVINYLQNISADKELPLGFSPGKAGNFSIEATEITNMDSGLRLMLLDMHDNVQQELTVGSPYSFESDAIPTNNRFTITFKSKGDITKSNNIDYENDVMVYTNKSNQITIVCNAAINSGSSISVYNAVGQKLEVQNMLNTITVMNRKFTPGIYFVVIDNEAGCLTKKKVVVD